MADAIKAIDDLISCIDCALVHPPMPFASIHKRRSLKELTNIEEVNDLYSIIYDLYANESLSAPFREPVDAIGMKVYNYYKVIDRPMSLRIILDRLAGVKDVAPYMTAQQVLEDCNQIWFNCEKFNGTTSELTAVAKHCAELLSNKVQKMANSKPASEKLIQEFEEYVSLVSEDENVATKFLEFIQNNLDANRLLTKDHDIVVDNLTVGDQRDLMKFLDGICLEKGLKRPRAD